MDDHAPLVFVEAHIFDDRLLGAQNRTP